VFFPENTLGPLKNKPVLISSASPSIYGGINAAYFLNTMFLKMGSVLCPHGLALSQANNIFDNKLKKLKDPTLQKRLEEGIDLLINLSKFGNY
jgi:NAD(P)H-dependent FMN reductase